MTQPINADYGVAQMETDDPRSEVVLIEFETTTGLLVLRIPAAGAAELESALSTLPLGHRPPRR